MIVALHVCNYTIYTIYYIQRNIFFRRSFFLYSSCHYMRAWIHILDAPICYERAVRAERKSTLQDSGLVRTVGPCMCTKKSTSGHRDALSNDWHESAVRFERTTGQALAIATKPRVKKEARTIFSYLSTVW